MDQDTIVIGVLACVAGFVLYRLYTTLGRRTGAEPVAQRPQPALGPVDPGVTAAAPKIVEAAAGPATEGVAAIARADPSFDIAHFLSGARSAYELIVGAFGKGDKEALRPLLTPRVFGTYEAAISKRQESGEPGPELVRLKSADLAGATLQDGVASVVVKFEAELADGPHGVRDAHEQWTFERTVRSSDPNWRLARVAAA